MTQVNSGIFLKRVCFIADTSMQRTPFSGTQYTSWLFNYKSNISTADSILQRTSICGTNGVRYSEISLQSRQFLLPLHVHLLLLQQKSPNVDLTAPGHVAASIVPPSIQHHSLSSPVSHLLQKALTSLPSSLILYLPVQQHIPPGGSTEIGYKWIRLVLMLIINVILIRHLGRHKKYVKQNKHKNLKYEINRNYYIE